MRQDAAPTCKKRGSSFCQGAAQADFILFFHINAKKTIAIAMVFLEAPPGFEPGDKGFADLGLTTWL